MISSGYVFMYDSSFSGTSKIINVSFISRGRSNVIESEYPCSLFIFSSINSTCMQNIQYLISTLYTLVLVGCP